MVRIQHFLKVLVLSAMVTLVPVSSAFGWDEVGHKLTAHIAWQQMKPEVREKVFRILMSAPENSDLNVTYDAFNSRSDDIKRLELFMFAGIWPDVIKDRKFEVRYKTYNHSNWHYGGVFWKQEQAKALILDDFKGDGGIGVEKLYEFEKALADPGRPDSEKAIAIAWLLHVGADIHNPLHNASRVTDADPEGDQGGNLVTLLAGDSKGNGRVNLHGYWDSIIGKYKPRKKDACDTDYLAPISRRVVRRYGFDKMKDRLAIGDYKLWSKEGFDRLPTDVYSADLIRGRMPSRSYQKHAFKLAEEQIALAGYRIGETLNRLFESAPDSSK